MGTDNTPSTNATTSMRVRRSFYRLHASTWVLLAPVISLFVVLIGPGVFSDIGGALSCEHGWPWTYLRREIISESELEIALGNVVWVGDVMTFPATTPAVDLLNAMNNDDDPDSDWLSAWAWGGGELLEWNWAALVGDIAIALLILASVAGILEWRRRRHARAWQFALGELGIVVTLVIVAFGWWRSNVNQSLAEAALTSLVDAPMPRTVYTPFTYESEYLGPNWLRHLLGRRRLIHFERVTQVTIADWRHSSPPAELLACKSIKSVKIQRVHQAGSLVAWLAEAPSIKNVDVGLARTDMLEVLCRTGRVTALDLSNWQLLSISDDDLEVLQLSPQLRTLNLEFAQITDDGVRHLVALQNLEELNLSGTKVTDAGTAKLTALKQLKKLDLGELIITDEALDELGKLASLTSLATSSPRITSFGLAKLTSLPSLAELHLTGVKVDDEGLAELQKITSLKKLVFNPEFTTNVAREEFSKALPNCEVSPP